MLLFLHYYEMSILIFAWMSILLTCFCYYDIKAIFRNFSTHSWWKSLSYRNQAIDLLCKSVDWLLYDRDLRHNRVKCLNLTFLRKFVWNLKGAYPKTLVLLKLQRYIDIAL